MSKKYYLVQKYETKEEFDKHFDSIYNSGYEQGYEDGMAEAVSYVFEMLDNFSHKTQNSGLYINGERQKQTAIRNMKAGIMPIIPDDPAIREHRKECDRRQNWEKLLKLVEKEAEEQS